MYARKLLVDQLERFAQAVFQRAFQFFGNGLAHLFQLAVVQGGHGVQAFVQRLAQAILPRLHGPGKLGHLLRGGGDALVEQRHALLLPLARGSRAFKHGLAQTVEHLRLRIQKPFLHGGALASFPPPQKRQHNQQHGQQKPDGQQRRRAGALVQKSNHIVLRSADIYHIIPTKTPPVHASGEFSAHTRIYRPTNANYSLPFARKWCILRLLFICFTLEACGYAKWYCRRRLYRRGCS